MPPDAVGADFERDLKLSNAPGIRRVFSCARAIATLRVLDTKAHHPRIALAHDWLVGYRGGEGVLDCIARLVRSDYPAPPGAPMLFTLFDDGRPLTPAIDGLAKRVSFLNRLPGSAKARRWLLPLYHAGVADLSRAFLTEHQRRPIDLLISTSSSAVHAIRTPNGVPHLCYCHSPPRYLWHLTDQYSGGLMGAGLAVFSPLLRRLDSAGAKRVTTFLANSTHTQEQIRRVYGRESTVVFPPVRTAYFTPGDRRSVDGPESKSMDLPDNFLLCAGALEPYKKADLAIEACRALGRNLVIAGSGSQADRLKALAAGSERVRFLGRVDSAQLLTLYRRADALLFPQLEDFGIIALEAQACGTPVVAFGRGGALDSVIDGKTGVHFAEQTAESLAEGIGRCPAKTDATRACRQNAERFSEDEFMTAMRRAIDAALL